MKAVILAGGYGTRLAEETSVLPKPMVEIGGKPILWHVMKHYAVHGISDFVICGGYKQEAIRRYFASYCLNTGDVTFDLGRNEVEYHAASAEAWRVTVADTGEHTMTGGRLARARHHIGDETFFLTYGDCVSDVDLSAVLAFHRESDALVTLTAVKPPGRFGTLEISHGEIVTSFTEKPDGDGAWINGGFFVVESEALDFISGDEDQWELRPLGAITRAGRLAAYRHRGYWQNMDSLRDKIVLEKQWAEGSPGWKTW